MNLEKMRREFIEKRYGKVELKASDALGLVDDLMKAETARDEVVEALRELITAGDLSVRPQDENITTFTTTLTRFGDAMDAARVVLAKYPI